MINMQSMTFGYGKSNLFESLDLSLEPGMTYGLLGLNGAGKTSLLKLLAGALFAKSGKISVYGENPRQRSAEHLANVCFVPDDPWAPMITVDEWVNRYSIFRPKFDAARLNAYVEEFQLDRSKQLAKYSCGQRKKFALACALSSNAQTLLLDEPTNGLDIPSKTQFRRVLANAAQDDRTIIISTHQVRDLQNLIDPVLILSRGKIVFNVSSDTLNSKLSCVKTSTLDGLQVVYAEEDVSGYTALVAGEGNPCDLELLFNAAVCEEKRLYKALNSEVLEPYNTKLLSSVKERV